MHGFPSVQLSTFLMHGFRAVHVQLSTFRVMSASRAGLPRSSCSVNPAEAEADVEVMSVVFRAGRVPMHPSVLVVQLILYSTSEYSTPVQLYNVRT